MTVKLFPPIPTETVKAVRPVFGGSNFYIAIGDQANHLFRGLTLSSFKVSAQESARVLAELYLITIFQYLETIPDRQAADAIRDRREWKYALRLPLNVPGFQPATFCEFRKSLLADPASLQVLQTLLSRLSELRASINEASLNLESGQVVARICLFSRLADTWEAMVQALEALALTQPEWLRSIALPYWYERYTFRRMPINLAGDSSQLEASAQAIGADGTYLLNSISRSNDQAAERLPQISSLRQTWQEQYRHVEGNTAWRAESCASCFIPTPIGN